MPKNQNHRKPQRDRVEIPIQSTPKRAFLATVEGERQPDGSIRSANGITWKVGR